MANNPNILIAGGKTGGHLFPGIATVQAMESMAPECRVLFVGTNAPFEVDTLARYGYPHQTILAAPVKGGSLLAKARAVVLILISLIQALILLLRVKPAFVLGVGAYSSFTLVLAAWILRIPRALQEQNTIPGITNRLLSRFVPVVFTAFETTRHIPEAKTRWVGNPMRKSTPAALSDDLPDIPKNDFIILVTGGSQGASSINRAVLDMAGQLENQSGLFIIHQTGTRDEKMVEQAYAKLNINAHSAAFFHDMPSLQDKADLVIARSGAGTISELAVKGCPAIFIPFPHAADDHQTFNAMDLEKKGAALVMADKDLSGDRLARMVLDLKSHPEKLSAMSNAMKKTAMPKAAQTIAAHILEEIKG